MTTFSTETRVFALSRMTNRDEAGRHFTNRYSDEVITDLESEGLITVYRPVHYMTGIDYDRSHWSVDVTGEGQSLVDAYPECWDQTDYPEGWDQID